MGEQKEVVDVEAAGVMRDWPMFKRRSGSLPCTDQRQVLLCEENTGLARLFDVDVNKIRVWVARGVPIRTLCLMFPCAAVTTCAAAHFKLRCSAAVGCDRLVLVAQIHVYFKCYTR